MKLTLKDFDYVINKHPTINIYKYMLDDINNYISNNVDWSELAINPSIRVDAYNITSSTLIITIYICDEAKNHIKTINIEYYYNKDKLVGGDFQTKKA